MRTNEQIKRIVSTFGLGNEKSLEIEQTIFNLLNEQKTKIKKSLPTHPDKMLKRKEVIDIINKI